jgi:hypothetical protein
MARWDADRYLRQSISYVMSTLSSPPEVVVLLGDVFSNGYRASNQHWQDYLNVSHSPSYIMQMSVSMIKYVRECGPLGISTIKHNLRFSLPNLNCPCHQVVIW